LPGNLENQDEATGQVIVLKMTPDRVQRLRRIVEIINNTLIEGTQEAAEAFIALERRTSRLRSTQEAPPPRFVRPLAPKPQDPEDRLPTREIAEA
jgi:hypothetical protein